MQMAQITSRCDTNFISKTPNADVIRMTYLLGPAVISASRSAIIELATSVSFSSGGPAFNSASSMCWISIIRYWLLHALSNSQVIYFYLYTQVIPMQRSLRYIDVSLLYQDVIINKVVMQCSVVIVSNTSHMNDSQCVCLKVHHLLSYFVML